MSDNQDENVKLYLKITGFQCSPDEISHIIGIFPTKKWLKGDIIDKRVIVRRKQNGWMLQSELLEDRPVKEHIENLLSMVMPKKERLKNIPPDAEIAIYCVVYSTLGRPDISLDPAMIKAIAELGAWVDFDLYQLPEH